MVVIGGVAGSGKSTVGRALADRLDLEFCEGDDLHPAANVERMRAGLPLDDSHRAPWLRAVARWIQDCWRSGGAGVVSCSALKRSYRDLLRRSTAAPLQFVLLDVDRQELAARLAQRKNHFMPPGLLGSQLATLEPPQPHERMLVADADRPVEEICEKIEAWLDASARA